MCYWANSSRCFKRLKSLSLIVGGVLGEVGELFRIFLHIVEHEALRLGALGGGTT